MSKATFRIWRGDKSQGAFRDYPTEVSEGMVVLDAVHRVQAEQAGDLAVRWNCKAGKCGSCSAEINGNPKLMCMTRLDTIDLTQPVTVEPMKAFPIIRDLVTDVSWNYKVKKAIKPFKPRKPDAPDGTWRMGQREVDRVQEFRKCIECFLCQDVCHILRDHHLHDGFIGPRFLLYNAALEMHPLDTEDRLSDLKDRDGVGYCNITRCCTKVCPEHITITENAIIPLKERVVDRFYDPVTRLLRMLQGSYGYQLSAAGRAEQLLFRPIEPPLDHVVHVGRDRVIPPQPAHHVRKNRAAVLLAVAADSPLEVEVVAFLGQRILQPHVLQEPVAQGVVSAASTDSAVVVAPILQDRSGSASSRSCGRCRRRRGRRGCW